MKKILLTTLIILLVFTGCKKIITETPYSFLTPANFPTSAEEADAALIGCYTALKDGGNGTWDYTGSLYMNTQNDLTFSYDNWSTFTGPTNGRETEWWKDTWKAINAANNLISALDSRDSTVDKWVPADLAEARAFRAFLYHNLACLFGDLPLRLKPTTEIALNLPRSPVQAIYDSIILPDLAYADGKLPVAGNSGGRIWAGGLKCIEADVYLKLAGWRRSSQGDMVAGDPKYWAMARDAAQAVLTMETNGIYTLDPDYSDIFTKLSTNVESDEVIWDLEFTVNAGSNFPYVLGARGGGDPDKGSGQNNLRIIPEWVKTRDTSDTRYQWNIGTYQFLTGWVKTPLTDTTQWGITTFQKIYPSQGYWQDNLTNWPFYRLGEVKLMYAEAANEANGGPTPEAYAQINAVRYRARPVGHKTDGTVLPDLSGLTQSQFRQAIMDERSMELVGEDKRRLDLIRWGILQQRIESMNFYIPYLSSVGGFNPRFYLWSLPVSDMTANGWQNNAGF
ncbi:MAG: RagB/SusD family nutrient uptake outer membrane protein [Ginsengibacter sp.]